jgi:NADPH:quinone reductase
MEVNQFYDHRMRAIQIDAFNGPLTEREVPSPRAAEGEHLVTLTHAAVNPLDVWTCQGNFAAVTKLPHTPGAEGLGTNEDGVLGVISGAGVGIARQGTYAEAISVPAAAWVPIPTGADPAQAVSMSVAGVTAFQSVHSLAKTTSSDVVLVLGASGGVGSLAAQIARNLGATVLGQTSSASKSQAVEETGAEVIVAADGDALTAALGDRKVSVVIDGLGGSFTGASIGAMVPFGRLVNYGTSAGVDVTLQMRNLYRNGVTVMGYTGLLLKPDERAAALAELFADLAAGKIRIAIDEILPLSGAGEAHRRILAKEVVGKLVLDVRA